MCTLPWLVVWASSKLVDLAPVTTALNQQHFGAAVQLTQSLLKGNPQDPRIWTLQGLAYDGLKEPSKALDDFRHAVSISPNYIPALKAEAQIEYANHDAQCVRTLTRITLLAPSDPVTHAMLGSLAYQREDCAAVVTNYSASEALIFSQAAATTEYGECLFQKGQKNKAVEVLQKAVALEPTSWQLRYNLALANLLLGKSAESIVAIEPVLQSNEPQVLDVASAAYEQAGDTPHAVQTLRHAIVQNPSNTLLYLHFADLCFAHDSFQVGIDMINAGVRKLPRSAQLHLARGILLVQLGEYVKAEMDFDQASQLDPSQTFSSVAHGLTQLQQSNPDAALAITRAQLEQTPTDPYLHYLKAETLRQKGVEPGNAEFREAVTAAETAVRLKPDLVLAQDLLGTFYLRQGDLAGATKQFHKVLQVEPNNESALYHLIVVSRKSGATNAIPDLMTRLAQAKTINQQRDEKLSRYRFVEPSRTQ